MDSIIRSFGGAKRKSNRRIDKKKTIYDNHGETWLYSHRGDLEKVTLTIGNVYYAETRFSQIVSLEQIRILENVGFDINFNEVKPKLFMEQTDPIEALIDELDKSTSTNEKSDVVISNLMENLESLKLKLSVAETSLEIRGYMPTLLNEIMKATLMHINDLENISRVFDDVNLTIVDEYLSSDIIIYNLNISKVSISKSIKKMSANLLELNNKMIFYWERIILILDRAKLNLNKVLLDNFAVLVNRAVDEVAKFADNFDNEYSGIELLSKDLDVVISELQIKFDDWQTFSKRFTNASLVSNLPANEIQLVPLYKFILELNSSLLSIFTMFSRFLGKYQQKKDAIYVLNYKINKLGPAIADDVTNSLLTKDFMRSTFGDDILKMIQENDLAERHAVATEVLEHLTISIETHFRHLNELFNAFSVTLLVDLLEEVLGNDYFRKLSEEILMDTIFELIEYEAIASEFAYSFCNDCLEEEREISLNAKIRFEVSAIIEESIVLHVVDNCLFVHDVYKTIVDGVIKEYATAAISRSLSQSLLPEHLRTLDDNSEDYLLFGKSMNKINSKSQFEPLKLTSGAAVLAIQESPRLVEGFVNSALSHVATNKAEVRNISPRIVEDFMNSATSQASSQIIANKRSDNSHNINSKSQFEPLKLTSGAAVLAIQESPRLVEGFVNSALSHVATNRDEVRNISPRIVEDFMNSAISQANSQIISNMKLETDQALKSANNDKIDDGSFEKYDLNRDGVINREEFSENSEIEVNESNNIILNSNESQESLLDEDFNNKLKMEGFRRESWKSFDSSSTSLHYTSSKNSASVKSLMSSSSSSTIREVVTKQIIQNDTADEVLNVLHASMRIIKVVMNSCLNAFNAAPSIEFLILDASVNRIRTVTFPSTHNSKVQFNFAVLKITHKLRLWIRRFLERKYKGGTIPRPGFTDLSLVPSLSLKSFQSDQSGSSKKVNFVQPVEDDIHREKSEEGFSKKDEIISNEDTINNLPPPPVNNVSVKIATESTLSRRITSIKKEVSAKFNLKRENSKFDGYNDNDNNNGNNDNNDLNNAVDTTEIAALPVYRRRNLMEMPENGFKKLLQLSIDSKLILCLNLSSNLLTNLHGIEVCINLKILDVSDNLIDSLSALKSCYNLIRLRAPGNKLVSVDINDMNYVPDDQNESNEMHGAFGDDIFNYSSTVRLQYLDISENDIKTLDGLKSCGSESLQHFEAKNCGLDMEKLNVIRNFKVLKVILLDNNKLSGIVPLVELLSSNLVEVVRELSFIGNPVVNERMKLNTNSSSGSGTSDLPSSPSPNLMNKKSMHYMLSMIDNFQNLELLDHNRVTAEMRNRFKLLKYQLDSEIKLRNIDNKYMEEMANATLIYAKVKSRHEFEENLLLNGVIGHLSSLKEERENFSEFAKLRLMASIEKRQFEDQLQAIVDSGTQSDSGITSQSMSSSKEKKIDFVESKNKITNNTTNESIASPLKRITSLNSTKFVSQLEIDFKELREKGI